MHESRTALQARLGNPPTALWAAGLFTVVYNAVFLCLLVIQPGSHAFFVALDDITQCAGIFVVVGLSLTSVVSTRRRGVRNWAPLLLCLGPLGFAIGQVIWTIYEVVLNQPTPTPSLADAFFLLEYPLLTAGILLLPHRPLSLASRGRALLDGLIALAGFLTFSWYFILGPTMLQDAASVLARVVNTAYPLWDLALIGCLLALLGRSPRSLMRPVVAAIVLGLLSVVTTDSIFDIGVLHNTYATGWLSDLGWPFGEMTVSLAGGMAAVALAREQSAGALRGTGDEDGDAELTPTSWGSLTPYAMVPAVAGLSIYIAHFKGDRVLEPGVYSLGAAQLLMVIARQAVSVLENHQLFDRLRDAYRQVGDKNRALTQANQRLQTLATTDPHTELPNHRALVSVLDQEIERCRRYGRVSAILVVDLDHFKTINDSFGHITGDAVLREAAHIMRATLRSVDTIGRWGGEEFLVILPEIEGDDALVAAERLREAVARHALQSAACHVTCSIGVAVYPDDGGGRDRLIEAADQAMYLAKRMGRNQTRAASESLRHRLPMVEPGRAEPSTLLETVEGLRALIAGKAQFSAAHTEAVVELAIATATALGCEAEEARMVGMAASVHDIGKIAVPDAVLLKPDRLNDDEWMLMRRHPIVGADIVAHLAGLAQLAPMVRSHHERWDGAGYPDGLEGNEIPLGARILAVVDAYVAMVQGRPYQAARDPRWALQELRECAGTQFDPRVVKAIERIIATRPARSESTSLAG
ncbi:MAG TPA: diguanylate cyclase [Chloroflexota bacterium]|nr:diguanylate cyclase [Chloroflexota bacterium]